MNKLVQGIWPLEQLANSSMGLFRMWVLITVGWLVVTTGLFWALWWLGTLIQGGSVLQGQQEWLNGYWLLTPLFSTFLILMIALIRKAEDAPRELLSNYLDMDVASRALMPSSRVWIGSCIVGVIYLYSLLALLNYVALLEGATTIEELSQPEFLLPHIPLIPHALIMAAILALSWHFFRYMWHMANHARIDLLNIDAYTLMALPSLYLLYWMLFCYAILGGLVIVIDINTMADHQVRLLKFTAGSQSATLGFIVICLLPVLKLRSRIQAEKMDQLNQINGAIAGDPHALEGSWIAHRRDLSLSDLYAHREFVNGVWAWPVSQQVGRIVFFLVLPPATWVMAAIVENLMFG